MSAAIQPCIRDVLQPVSCATLRVLCALSAVVWRVGTVQSQGMIHPNRKAGNVRMTIASDYEMTEYSIHVSTNLKPIFQYTNTTTRGKGQRVRTAAVHTTIASNRRQSDMYLTGIG